MPMGVDPMAVDWRPGGRVGGAMSDATTDEEPAHPERGDGGAALAAAGSAAALEAAAMRASDELQRMTISKPVLWSCQRIDVCVTVFAFFTYLLTSAAARSPVRARRRRPPR